MKHIDNTDAITNSQNEGHACPSCGSRFGHYSRCTTLSFDGRNAYTQVATLREKLNPYDAVYISVLDALTTASASDRIYAHALGVTL